MLFGVEKNDVLDKLRKNMVVIRLLGKGGSGSVYMVREKYHTTPYAMKIQAKDTIWDENVGCVNDEIRVLRTLNREGFPFAARVAFAAQDLDNLYAFMEFEQGGDLARLLERKDWILSIDEVRFYFTEIIVGLAKIHSLGFIHRDMKPANVLIGKDGHIRLADLGTVIRPKDLVDFDPVTTIVYTPPECTLDVPCRYTYAVDWWAIGLMMLECGSGIHPFGHIDPNAERELYAYIREYDFVQDEQYSCMFCETTPRDTLELYSLVALMLERDPEDRFGVMPFIDRTENGKMVDRTRKFGDSEAAYPEDVLSHPFFQFESDGSRVKGMDEETILSKGLVPPALKFDSVNDSSCFPEVELGKNDTKFEGFGPAADPRKQVSRVGEFPVFWW
ncbi:kinase-like protein [Cylindrobasidium torrendii FP15055 ss-10]|uniref:non-specific serine/threonine protein kinase n=1 Tax=Cylindrobasidium torrendii FP15055 ss-10 TaxID=1314674 RepID=A0A0D7AVN2_9AGAR|nr:kinase-like protein [Cylindrobasidium torrendii FP15055 ss-10]